MKRKKAILSDSEDEEAADTPGKLPPPRPVTFWGRGLLQLGKWPLPFLSLPLPLAVKRSRAVSDDDDDNSDDDAGGSPGPDRSLAAKLRELGSDSGSEDEAAAGAEGAGKKDEKALFGSDSDSGDDNQEE